MSNSFDNALACLQIRLVVLVPLVQLSIQVVLGGLGGGVAAGPRAPQAQVCQGDSAEVSAAVLPPEGRRRRAGEFPGPRARHAGTGHQIQIAHRAARGGNDAR